VDGFRWRTPAELIAKTLRVAGNPQLREELSAAAVARAQDFSDQAFADRWREIVRAHGLLDPKD
jgi:hypothetical protein